MRIDGTEIAKKLYGELQKRVNRLKQKNITPHLVAILVGEHPASVAYVSLKQRKAEEIGAKVTVLNYKTDVTTEELIEKVKLLNDDPFVHAILIQRPLPDHIDIEKLELTTEPKKDVDGFHPKSPFTLPLPLAVVKILEEIYLQTNSKSEARNPKQIKNTPNKNPKHLKHSYIENSKIVSNLGFRYSDFISWLKDKNIVLLGKGPTGGGPVLAYLKTIHVKPYLVDSKTKNPEKSIKQADIIISAVGRKNTIKPEMLKKGVILISVGINRGENKKLHGDYETDEIKDVSSYYTPTPGGVGPVNVAMLMENVLTSAEKQNI